MEWLSRTELLVGEENLQKLNQAKILVLGLGGVGAYAAEMLCRAGIGTMTIVDGDKVQASNRNRQLIALTSTEHKKKAELLGERLKDINPNIRLTILSEFITDEKMLDLLSTEKFDYVVDAIDTLAPKVALIYHCVQQNIKVVSSMGAGGRFNPQMIKVADIAKSHNCTLARSLRKRLHPLGIYSGVKVVFSGEEVDKNSVRVTQGEQNKKSMVGTISYMPAIFGCFCASVVIRYLLGEEL